MKKEKIGWIGTGVMGKSMLKLLSAKGYETFVHTRTKAKAKENLTDGAQWCHSPAEVANRTDIIFTIVGYPKDVEEVYFGHRGIFSAVGPGSLLIDMTTTKPSLSKAIQDKAIELGCQSIDAPVSGGDVGARNGSLSIMIGAEESAYNRALPLFQIMGNNIVHCGPAGAGQHTKMCNQIAIAGTMIGVCESLLYAKKAGVDPLTVLSAISGGAAGCWTLDNLAPRIIKRDFEPGFYVAHFVKDLEIALDESRRMQVSLPGLALVHQLYTALKGQGMSQSGTQALSIALERLSGLDDKS